jgi:hypothetical protein
MSESIGMMDKAYFVGKVEILNWFNTLLQVSELTDINERPYVAQFGKDRVVCNWSSLLCSA